MRFKSSNFTFFTQFSKQILDINPLHDKEDVNLKLMMIGITECGEKSKVH
jgi:hypothetical protein